MSGLGYMCMTVFSIGCTCFIIFIIAKIRRIQSWPIAYGEVQSDSLTWAGTATGDAVGRYYRPQVKFTYVIDEQEYEGKQLLPIGWVVLAQQQSETNHILLNLSCVHYNVKDFKKSYLGLPCNIVRPRLYLLYVALILSLMTTFLSGVLLVGRN